MIIFPLDDIFMMFHDSFNFSLHFVLNVPIYFINHDIHCTLKILSETKLILSLSGY